MASDRGAAMIEMAAVTIFLVLLVLGIADLGRAIFTNIAVRDAVQDGAHFAAFTDDATAAEIDARIRTVARIDLTGADIRLYCSEHTRALQDGSTIRIELDYDVNLVTPIVGPMLGGSIALQPSAEADRFFATCPSGVVDPLPG